MLPATTLVIGHNVMFHRDVWRMRSHVRVHRTQDSGHKKTAFALHFVDVSIPREPFLPSKPRPWLNASVDQWGNPCLWRLDVAASRSWWTMRSDDDHDIWPQVLVLLPKTGAIATKMASKPIRKKKRQR